MLQYRLQQARHPTHICVRLFPVLVIDLDDFLDVRIVVKFEVPNALLRIVNHADINGFTQLRYLKIRLEQGLDVFCLIDEIQDKGVIFSRMHEVKLRKRQNGFDPL